MLLKIREWQLSYGGALEKEGDGKLQYKQIEGVNNDRSVGAGVDFHCHNGIFLLQDTVHTPSYYRIYDNQFECVRVRMGAPLARR